MVHDIQTVYTVDDNILDVSWVLLCNEQRRTCGDCVTAVVEELAQR